MDTMTVQSVDRALSILELLSNHPKGLGLIAISKELNLPKSTVHRLAHSLISRDFIYQSTENESYNLSLKVAKLAFGVIENIDIRKKARPFIEELSTKVNEVVHLCILDGHEVVYIDKVERNRTLRMYSQIGKRALLHCTGVGKMILSGLEDSEINDIINQAGLPMFTENTITSKVALLKEIQLIRSRGFSLDKEEHESGIYCISAPVYDYTGEIIAGFSVSGPTDRMKKGIESNHYKDYVLETSRLISELMGYKKES